MRLDDIIIIVPRGWICKESFSNSGARLQEAFEDGDVGK